MQQSSRGDWRFEIALYQLSAIEQDALNHYPGGAPPYLSKKLRGAILVFQNILSDLWRRGLRLRIVPEDSRITDLPECLDMKRYTGIDGKNSYDDKAAGVYRSGDKLVLIREEYLCVDGATNQKYWVIIHEFAHAIWHLMLESEERTYVGHLYEVERFKKPASREYRLSNVSEFFADGFLYFVTPHREGLLLKPTENWQHGVRQRVAFGEEGVTHASNEDLKELNIKLYDFLERKFRKIIDPELVMAKPINKDEEESFEMWPDKGFYGPIINCGTITSLSAGVRVVEYGRE
jgi:hypothetical protein